MTLGDEMVPLSRTALQAQRLKPALGQVAVKRVWSHRRRAYIDLFDPRACVPMAARRAPTPAQLAALEVGRRKLTHAACCGCGCGESVERNLLSREALCPDCVDALWKERLADEKADREAELAELHNVPEGRTLYLDTETTGLSAACGDEILEIAIVDDTGAVLLDTLVRPVVRTCWPVAQEIHGITSEAVSCAPPLKELTPSLAGIFADCDQVVIYNAVFDLSFLPREIGEAILLKTACAMRAYAVWYGEWSRYHDDYRLHDLASAARRAGHVWDGKAHRARADALAVRSVWQWLRGVVAAGADRVAVNKGEGR